MSLINKKAINWITLLLLSALIIACSLVGFYNFVRPKYLQTETFIASKMVNANGTLATYLVDTPRISANLSQGREALSESLGLWMMYAVEKKDRALFEQNYAALQNYFLSPEGLVYWKLSQDGQKNVSTNALVDDLRIAGALFAAEELWGEPEWGNTARKIGSFLSGHLVKSGLFVDFFDLTYRNSPNTVTLSYLDLGVCEQLVRREIVDDSTYENNLLLLRSLPNDGVFFPQTYNVVNQTYAYDDTVNLIDQLLMALYRINRGIRSPELYTFIKQKFELSGTLYGSYNRKTRTPPRLYESPAVYALTIMYALEVDDTRFALAVYKRMVLFRAQSGQYAGGYVTDGNTHIFDNLFPVLAEHRLYRAKPWYFLFSL